VLDVAFMIEYWRIAAPSIGNFSEHPVMVVATAMEISSGIDASACCFRRDGSAIESPSGRWFGWEGVE
jgi:hypothetical protein